MITKFKLTKESAKMTEPKTKTLVIEAKLKITVPASLNDSQLHSIFIDLRGAVPSNVMTGVVKSVLKSHHDWSHKQVVSSELLIETNTFTDEVTQPSCRHCGANLTLESSVIRDYVNKASDEDAEDISA